MSFFYEESESLSAKAQAFVFLARPRSILRVQIIDCIQSKFILRSVRLFLFPVVVQINFALENNLKLADTQK